MKATIQRVKEARVIINNRINSAIYSGLLVYLGVKKGDTKKTGEQLAKKIIKLRIFPDNNNKMNLSLQDIEGEILIVSQFTLYANCSRGHRPSFSGAENPEQAKNIYNEFVNYIKRQGIRVKTGEFGANMDIYSINHGPVTIQLKAES